jgi:hypothetical protein
MIGLAGLKMKDSTPGASGFLAVSFNFITKYIRRTGGFPIGPALIHSNYQR